MGWPKCFEDNLEALLDRLTEKEPVTKVEVEHTGFLSHTRVSVTVENKEQMHVSAYGKVQYTDRYIVCKDCGEKFLFTAKSQRYFAAKGWSDPKRCKCCREMRNMRYLMCSSF